MITRVLPDFDLAQIARSGQCFRMQQVDPSHFVVIAHGRRLQLVQHGDTVQFACTQEEYDQVWHSYFDLDTDYARFKGAVGKRDRYLQAAVQCGWGLRILRQEPWETIVCFLISQQNNIARITGCVERLCRLCGKPMHDQDGTLYYAMPTPAQLSALTVDDLAPVRLGYRARYLIETARQVQNGVLSLERLPRMRYQNARRALVELSGVGIKVAECICLFGLHHLSAFPIDTHIRQVLDQHYPKGFPFSRYRGFAGVMQQYAFFYELMRDKPPVT